MLAEGRRRAAAAELDNLSFVLGGSDDLATLSPELGTFAAVTISQAFHWMSDQDGVLRDLDELVERERGAIAIVGYVEEPDSNAVWLDRPPWNVVETIRRRHLVDVPEGPRPAGRHDPFPEILARSAFSAVELLTHEYDAVIHPSIDAAIGFQPGSTEMRARGASGWAARTGRGRAGRAEARAARHRPGAYRPGGGPRKGPEPGRGAAWRAQTDAPPAQIGGSRFSTPSAVFSPVSGTGAPRSKQRCARRSPTPTPLPSPSASSTAH